MLSDVLHRPALLPIPGVRAEAACSASDLAEALLFTGQRVLPRRLEAGRLRAPRHPLLVDALEAMLGG